MTKQNEPIDISGPLSFSELCHVWQHASRLFHLGSYEAALLTFSRLEARATNSLIVAMLATNAGICASHLQDYTRAINLFCKAIEVESSFCPPSFALGCAASQLEDFKLAFQAFRRCRETMGSRQSSFSFRESGLDFQLDLGAVIENEEAAVYEWAYSTLGGFGAAYQPRIIHCLPANQIFESPLDKGICTSRNTRTLSQDSRSQSPTQENSLQKPSQSPLSNLRSRFRVSRFAWRSPAAIASEAGAKSSEALHTSEKPCRTQSVGDHRKALPGGHLDSSSQSGSSKGSRTPASALVESQGPGDSIPPTNAKLAPHLRCLVRRVISELHGDRCSTTLQRVRSKYSHIHHGLHELPKKMLDSMRRWPNDPQLSPIETITRLSQALEYKCKGIKVAMTPRDARPEFHSLNALAFFLRNTGPGGLPVVPSSSVSTLCQTTLRQVVHPALRRVKARSILLTNSALSDSSCEDTLVTVDSRERTERPGSISDGDNQIVLLARRETLRLLEGRSVPTLEPAGPSISSTASTAMQLALRDRLRYEVRGSLLLEERLIPMREAPTPPSSPAQKLTPVKDRPEDSDCGQGSDDCSESSGSSDMRVVSGAWYLKGSCSER